MSRFCLLPKSLLSSCPKDSTALVLDAWDVPEDAVSMPAHLSRRLKAFRARHAAWAYEMGNLPTPEGKLCDVLKQGSSLSAWWCSLLYERHPKVTPALYTLHLLEAVEDWLKENACAENEAGDGSGVVLEVHGLSQIGCGMLEAMCQAYGWSYVQGTVVEKDRPSRLRALYEAAPPFLRALARLAHWLLLVKRHLPKTTLERADHAAGTTGTIATYFPNIDVAKANEGIFRSRYWESLHDVLAQDDAPPVRWLFVRFPSPQASLARCVSWARGFAQRKAGGVSFNYLEEFLGAKDMAKAFWRFVRLSRASARIEKPVSEAFRHEGSKLGFWPLLRGDYIESFRGWRGLERCLQEAGIRNYLEEVGPQRFVSFPLENCPWERMLVHHAHELHVGPVYGAQHSTIRPTDFRYFDDGRTWDSAETESFQPDAIAGNGESACTQWREAQVPDSRLTKVEALRYLYLADLAGRERDSGENAAGKTGFSNTVLLVTSFFADETRAHIELFAQCVKEGALSVDRCRIKPHPYYPVDELLKEFLGDARKPEVVTTPLPGELAARPVVWASNSTTAALEAALMGLPVLVMQPAGDFDLCPLQDVEGLPRTHDVASVRQALERPSPIRVPDGYLCLEKDLLRWRRLLGLPEKRAS